MSKTNTGGPAFPQPAGVAADGTTFFDGMTLRDYFAAKAMQALLPILAESTTNPKTIAEKAFVMSDLMLKAREA